MAKIKEIIALIIKYTPLVERGIAAAKAAYKAGVSEYKKEQNDETK